MKKFIVKLFFFSLPVLLILVGVNYIGDAANLFSKNYEERISKYLLEGFNVTNVYNYDERVLQRDIIKETKKCPDVIALGSSRIMLINSSYFPNQSFLNNGVSGASIEDLIAIYRIYELKKFKPKKVIIGLDPWFLNINNEQNRWQSLSIEYNSFLKEEKLDTIAIAKNYENKYKSLISLSYFQSSVKALVLKKGAEIKPTLMEVNDAFTKHKDGSINYDLDYRNASAKDVESKAIAFCGSNIYSIEKFNELSGTNMHLLNLFLDKFKNDHVEMVFVLMPYHPIVYNRIKGDKKYNNVIESEVYFRKLADRYHSKCFGSFDSGILKLDGSYFYDGMHLNEKGVRKVLKN
jgi:hypothetical protein